METIYLAIIIGYVLFRAARFLFQYRSLYKLLGFKRVWIAGNPVIIKRLEPKDFIEEPNGLPITLFQYQKGRTLVDEMRNNDQEDDSIIETVNLARKLAEKAVVYMGGNLKIDNLFDCGNPEAVKLGWELYGRILNHNFKTLYKTYHMDKQYVIHMGELCVAFGKMPHEHITNPKRLNELEKYIIDEFVFNTYTDNENRKAEAAAAAQEA